MALDPAAGPRENASGLVVILKDTGIALAAAPNQNVRGLAAALNQSVTDLVVVPRANGSALEVAPRENEILRVKEISLETDHVVSPRENGTDLMSDHAVGLRRKERGLGKDLVVSQKEREKVPERDPEVSPRENTTGLVVIQEAAEIVLGVDQTLNGKDLPIVVPDPLPRGKMVRVMPDPGLNRQPHLPLPGKGLFLHLHALPPLPALGLVLVPQSSLCCEVDLYAQCYD